MFQIEAIDHVVLIVRDMERAIRWYQDVLGMERRYHDVWTGKRDPVVMAVGDVQVALFAPAGEDYAYTHDWNEHFAVRVDRANFELARRELEKRGISVNYWDHTICHSLYFYDPDGNQIEVTTFELA